MSYYELITDDEYSKLPDEDEQCFVEFESICRRNMTKMIDNDTSGHFDTNIRQQYMAAVSAVASECSVPNIFYSIANEEDSYEEFVRFSLAVQGEVARIRIRQRGDRHPYSVLLTGNTRTKIDHYISRIRELVNGSEMDLDRKKKLFEKLDSFVKELSGRRLSFAKTNGHPCRYSNCPQRCGHNRCRGAERDHSHHGIDWSRQGN